MQWPNDKAAAFATTFDFDAEEVWIAEDPGNRNRPGVLSQGAYGAKVGVSLVLDLLDSLSWPATFFVPGLVAERHGEEVKMILDAGHEIGLHGHSHCSPAALSQAEEQKELLTSMTALRRIGAESVGYRSPSWDFSPHTLDILDRAGVLYSSNLMDDIRPYRHPGRRVIELPVHWSLDDAPHFWFDGKTDWHKKISTPSEVREIWQAEFEGIRRLHGLCVLTMHPQICGRPGRLDLVRDFLEYVSQRDDVWVAEARGIAQHVDAALP